MNELIKNKKQPLRSNWWIDTDFENEGKQKNYPNAPTETARPTTAPATIQESFPEYYGAAWYWCRFACELVPQQPTDHLILRVGAADYKADVWMNGNYLGEFEGGETAFTFDVTDSVKAEGENLLTIRVINPCDRNIDGLTITNSAGRNKRLILQSGHTINYGGLLDGVDLFLREAVAVSDLFVVGDPDGTVKAKLTLNNTTEAEAKAMLTVTVAEKGGTGSLACRLTEEITVPVGESVKDVVLTVNDPLLWNLDDPNLYGFACELVTPYGASTEATRFGFRDFRVVDGFFYLNGKRLFLKCAHSGNDSPIGIAYPKVKDFVRRDFISAKASGFNAIRAIAGMFRPDQLDFCDEIGLMIIEECYAGWMLGVDINPETPTPDEPENYLYRFDVCTANMMRQDKNHPSVVAYQLLNETGEGPVFRQAVAFLPKAREIDESRLIMLNSGRFDADFSIGCAANPYVHAWTKMWGADSRCEIEGIHEIGPSLIGVGDVHCYPTSPHDEHTYDYIMKIGTGMRPVVLSEYGIGTSFHVIHEARMFEQYFGYLPDLCDYKWVKKQSDDLIADFSKFGFDRVYPFPETMLNESLRLGARQRNLGFNLIRANPQISGFSMTGLLDHGMCGEGCWTYWRRWKPEMFDIMSDGFSSLRFCLMTYPTNAYAGRPFRVKASLATEDALRPGTYSASFCIMDENCRIVWRKEADVVIPESMPLAVPIFDEKITLDVPSGKYTLFANLNEGGSPTGEKLAFYVTNENDFPRADGAKLYTWGVCEEAKAYLAAIGVTAVDYDGQSDAPVFVGNPADFDQETKWTALQQGVANGQTAVYLQSRFFLDHPETAAKTGLAEDFTCRYTQDFLYHKEYVPLPHPVFDGIKPGMFDLDYVGSIFPHETIETETTLDPICSGFVTGNIWVAGAYHSSYSMARREVGRGSVLVSMPYILENIGKNPVADRLLINLVRFVCGLA